MMGFRVSWMIVFLRGTVGELERVVMMGIDIYIYIS